MAEDVGEADKSEDSREQIEPGITSKDDKQHQGTLVKSMLATSVQSLPIPGARDVASFSDASNDVSREHGNDDDDDDRLTCREMLPSPPVGLLDEVGDFEPSPGRSFPSHLRPNPVLTVFGDRPPGATTRNNDPGDCSGKAPYVLKPISSSSSSFRERGAVSGKAPPLALKPLSSSAVIEREDPSRIHLELPRRRSSRSPIPIRLPGSSLPDKKTAPPRKRLRAARRLPTASTRSVSHRGRLRGRVLSREEESSDSEELKLLSRRFSKTSPNALLSSSTQLAYSWDRLGLGKELGSAAFNRYLAKQRGEEGPFLPNLTAQEMLQIMNSLRIKTLLPPPGSDLHRIVQKNRFENRLELYGPGSDAADEIGTKVSAAKEAGNSELDDAPPPPCKIPFTAMARLYERMCAQDADDGSSSRREAQYLSADATIERLRSLENKSCELKLRESEVLSRGAGLGLIDTIHSSIPGYARIPGDTKRRCP